MAKKTEIVVELRLEDKNALQRLGQLEIETRKFQRELKELNAEIAKNGRATREQTEQAGKLSASIRRNQTVIRELKNDLSGATAAGLRFRDKMAEASRAGLGAFGLQAASITAITVGLVQAVKELANLSAEIEKVDARNSAIAGESLPALTKAAEDNANAIGLTRREYVSLAADQVLRLKNLGIEGDLVEKLAIQTVEQAEALSDFSAGELDTEQAAKLLNDALTGQTRGLKELGINVKASREEIDRIADGLIETEGLTREQATAVATLQLAFESTEETLSVFTDQTLAIDKAQDSANARLKEAKEALAEGLTPALTAVTEGSARFLAELADFTKEGSGLEKFIAIITGGASESFRAGAEALFGFGEESRAAAPKVATAFDTINASSKDLLKQLDTLTARRKQFIDAGNLKGAASFDAEIDTIKKAIEARGGLAALQDEVNEGLAEEAAALTTVGARRAILNEELKKAKENRDALNESDLAGRKEQDALIVSIEKSIAALDGSTKKTKEKKDAVVELTAAQKEQLALEQAIAEIPSGKDALAKPQQEEVASIVTDDKQPAVDAAKAAAIEFQEIQNQLRLQEAQGIVDFNTQLLALDAAYYDQKILSAEEYAIEKARLDKAIVDSEIENQRLQVQAAADLFGSLSQLAEQGSEEFKAFAITQALINTYLGASQTLADTTLPTFAKFAAAAAIIIAGLANVRQIQGFREGGRVQRDDGAPIQRSNGDNVLITAKAGEVILNEEQQRRIQLLFGNDAFNRAGVPGFIGGGLVRSARGTALVNTPRPSSGEIVDVEAAAETRAISFSPVVSVVEMNKVQDRVRVVEKLTTA